MLNASLISNNEMIEVIQIIKPRAANSRQTAGAINPSLQAPVTAACYLAAEP
jgi:hypothetical protein